MNLLIITAVFIVLLLIIAGFVSQQISTAQQIRESKKPKSLLEKMNRGIGALDTEKFRQIVMEGSPDGLSGQVEALIEEKDRTSASNSTLSKLNEMPDDLVIVSDATGAGGFLNLEGKDLQTIYAEYLSEKNVNPFDMEPEFKLGVAYIKFSQFEKAIKQFEKVVDDKPDFPGINYYLGEAYRCNGQFYEAMKSYKRSWEMESKAQEKAQAEKQKIPEESVLSDLD